MAWQVNIVRFAEQLLTSCGASLVVSCTQDLGQAFDNVHLINGANLN